MRARGSRKRLGAEIQFLGGKQKIQINRLLKNPMITDQMMKYPPRTNESMDTRSRYPRFEESIRVIVIDDGVDVPEFLVDRTNVD